MEEAVALIQELHALGAEGGAGVGHVADLHDLLRCADVQCVKDDGGAEEPGSEGVGCGFCFGLYNELLATGVPGVAFLDGVAHEDMPQLMGDGKAAGAGRILVIDDNIPRIVDGDGSASVPGGQHGYRAVGDDADAAIFRDGL